MLSDSNTLNIRMRRVDSRNLRSTGGKRVIQTLDRKVVVELSSGTLSTALVTYLDQSFV